MKKKELNILTKNLTNYQYIKNYKKVNLNDVMMDFDSTSLYPNAMWDNNSVYPKIETAFAFEPDMIDVFVKVFNIQSSSQDGDESAILRIKYYNPPNLIFHHLPVEEKIKKIEVNRMRNGYIIDNLTSVDFQANVKKLEENVLNSTKMLFIEKILKLFLVEKL